MTPEISSALTALIVEMLKLIKKKYTEGSLTTFYKQIPWNVIYLHKSIQNIHVVRWIFSKWTQLYNEQPNQGREHCSLELRALQKHLYPFSIRNYYADF